MATPARAPADRLEALGRPASQRRKLPGGPAALTARHNLLIAYMIDGCQHPELLTRIKRQKAILNEVGEPVIGEVSPEVGEPLTLIEAADLLRIRRRNARELFGLPIFQKAYHAAVEAYRSGERAASMRTLVEVRDDPGAGSAADRKVRMQAAQALIGEGATNLTVNMPGSHTRITAGVVIRIRDRLHAEPPMRTIDHEAPRSPDRTIDDEQRKDER